VTTNRNVVPPVLLSSPTDAALALIPQRLRGSHHDTRIATPVTASAGWPFGRTSG